MKIEMVNLNKSYKNHKALNDLNLSFDIDKNNIYGIVGPNGAGKTTMLKILAGILLQSSGEINVEGVQGTKYDIWARENIAFIPAGERGLYYKNTVLDNILYFGSIKGTDKETIVKNIEIYAPLFNMEEVMHKKIDQLSTGFKKKAALMCVMCADKKLLILDEPSLGLDLDAASELHKALVQVSKSCDTTILISSHDPMFLSDLANEYYFLLKGKCVKTVNDVLTGEGVQQLYFSLKGEGE